MMASSNLDDLFL